MIDRIIDVTVWLLFAVDGVFDRLGSWVADRMI